MTIITAGLRQRSEKPFEKNDEMEAGSENRQDLNGQRRGGILGKWVCVLTYFKRMINCI